MRLIELRLRNFTVHRDLTLEFRPGINGIVGPNGSGKSSILQALQFVVTGEISTVGTKTDNITWGEKQGHVQLRFEHAQMEYTLRRNLGGGGPPELSWADQQVRTAKDVEKVLTETLGTTFAALLNNVFVPQGAIDSILFSTNTERLKEIQQVVGLHRCADAEKALQVEISRYTLTVGLEEQIRASTQGMDQATAELRRALTQRSTLEQQAEALGPQAEQLREWVNNRRVQEDMLRLDADIQEAEGERQGLLDAVGRFEAVQKELLQHLQVLVPQVQDAQQLLFDHEVRRKGQDTRQRLTTQLAEAQAVLDRVPDVPVADDLRHRHERVKQMIELCVAQSEGRAARPVSAEEQQALDEQKQVQLDVLRYPAAPQYSDELIAKAERANALAEQLRVFADGVCPTCERPMESFDPTALESKQRDLQQEVDRERQEAVTAHKAGKAALQQRQQDVDARVQVFAEQARTALQQVLAKARTKQQELQSQVDALTAQQELRRKSAERAQELATQLQELGGSQEQDQAIDTAQLQAVIRRQQELQAQAQKLETELAVARERLAGAAARLAQRVGDRKQLQLQGLVPSDEQLQAAQQAVDELGRLRQVLREVDQQIARQEALTAQFSEANRKQREQLEREAADAKWVGVCRQVREVMHVSGLPQRLMREYAKVLNRRMLHYLRIWGAPFQLRLDDQLEFQAQYPEGVEHRAGRLSGGQKIVASTSFRLAMADTFARQVGLLVLDEPSVYLDKDNFVHLQNLLLRLKELAGGSGKQIILVTHEEQLLGFFDHQISIYR